ncbi:MAG TPA: hypothetical protein HA349_02680 [Methanotrichaceae archaeon]|nr:hypothetical protein [Methanotrichaceae archaeon]
MNTETRSSQVIFFLGAGASVAAGVPTTYDFVDQFIEYMGDKDTDEQSKIKDIIEILKSWTPDGVDIEILLETLTKLKNKDQEPILQFCMDGNLKLDGDFEKLIKDLKDFIKSKTMVHAETIDYLRHLRGFVIDAKNRATPTPLDIISLNYDTCIEQFCNIHEMSYQDGFDIYWNLKTFEREDADIRLYKLHGSVLWYQSDRGNFIKLPILSEDSKIQLFSREYAENLMLYPMQKWDYAEPLLELMVRIKGLIQSKIRELGEESESLKFLIVVGYSFRDEHIKKIVWDAARRNTKLYVIIIDPNAYQIYHDRVKYYDSEGEIASHLSGRVIYLPYKFEEIVSILKNDYVSNLNEGIRLVEKCQKNEDIGEFVRWTECIKPLIDAEYHEMVENIIKTKNIMKELDWGLNSKISIKIGMSLLLNKQYDQASKYLDQFYSTIEDVITDLIKGNISESGYASLEINSHGLHEFERVIADLYDFCKIRHKMCSGSDYDVDQLTKFISMFNKILEYIKILPKRRQIDPQTYRPLDPYFNERYAEFIDKDTSTDRKIELKSELESMIKDEETTIIRDIVELSKISSQV